MLDDRAVLAVGGELVEVDVLALLAGDLHGVAGGLGLGGVGGGLLHHLVDGAGGAVHAAERLVDAALGGDHRHDVHLRARAQVVERQDVHRVGHGDEELVAEHRDGHQLVALGHVLGHEVHHRLGHVDLRQVDRRLVQAAAHGDDHVLLGDELVIRQQLEQSAALFFLQFLGFLQLAGQQKAVLDQNVRDAFAEGFCAHE